MEYFIFNWCSSVILSLNSPTTDTTGRIRQRRPSFIRDKQYLSLFRRFSLILEDFYNHFISKQF